MPGGATLPREYGTDGSGRVRQSTSGHILRGIGQERGRVRRQSRLPGEEDGCGGHLEEQNEEHGHVGSERHTGEQSHKRAAEELRGVAHPV